MIRYRSYCVLLLSLLLALVVPSCSPDDKEPQVEANEDLFINEVYASSGEDWIELYNNTSSEKNIGGYRIYDDAANKYHLSLATVIPAKGFLVLICDDGATGLHTNFKLSAAGETVYLENSAGEIIDLVEFPVLKDGESHGRYPDGTTEFKISGSATKGLSNGEGQAPIIASVGRDIKVPGLADEVVIKVEASSSSVITEAKLFYRFNGGDFTSVAMVLNQSFYEASIPAFNATGEVEYYVSIKNSAGLVTLHPFDAPEKLHDYLLNTDVLPQLRINEFLAINSSCCPDTDGDLNEFDDWIEIYNEGTEPIDIGGMYLSDDKGDPFKSKIPKTNSAATTIQPGGYLVIWADEQQGQGELHVGFKLSSDGEDIGLFYKDGRTIHTYTFGPQEENVSMGLGDDGETWESFSTPTPDGSNQL